MRRRCSATTTVAGSSASMTWQVAPHLASISAVRRRETSGGSATTCRPRSSWSSRHCLGASPQLRTRRAPPVYADPVPHAPRAGCTRVGGACLLVSLGRTDGRRHGARDVTAGRGPARRLRRLDRQRRALPAVRRRVRQGTTRRVVRQREGHADGARGRGRDPARRARAGPRRGRRRPPGRVLFASSGPSRSTAPRGTTPAPCASPRSWGSCATGSDFHLT